MEKLYADSETGCCPRFDPTPWDDKEVVWEGKLFLKDHVRCLFHIPIGFGKLIVKDMELIAAAHALTPQPLMLMEDRGLFGADVYIAVDGEVPQTRTARISGRFLSRVFEGPYKDAGKWDKRMREYVKSKGEGIRRMYFFYTTCPACAKHYGKNYTVLLAEV